MTKKEKKIIKIASPMQQYLVLYKRREIRNQFTCNIQESRMHVSDVSGYFAKKKSSNIFAVTSSLVPVRGLAIVVKLEGVKQGWAIERGARGIGGARPCKLDCNVHKYSTNENWFWCGAINNPLPFSPPLLASHCRASFNECKNAETGKAA